MKKAMDKLSCILNGVQQFSPTAIRSVFDNEQHTQDQSQHVVSDKV